MSVMIFGADGYLGWALTSSLAQRTQEPIIAVDDLSKRGRVAELGFASAVPILPFGQRVARLRETTGRADIAGVEAPVTECVEELLRDFQPRTVVHLAQIPSAPYSMRSFLSARETVENNVIGNLAVLFALREHCPTAHLVKMGSMGEYARCGVPLGEGYVDAVLDGETTSRPIPFPREADDIYHITKINDTEYISMACRVWGLAATDVMQSIVYGLRTPLAVLHPELSTRFDCDPVFGSVLNRFVAQAVHGTPLTVHAGGTGTTGLIALAESIAALTHWMEHPAGAGEHRVVNQATETRLSIFAIAELVQRVAREQGLATELNLELDPRHELERPAEGGPARNLRLQQAGIPTVPLDEGIRQLLEDVRRHRATLSTAAALPTIDWRDGELATDRLESLLDHTAPAGGAR